MAERKFLTNMKSLLNFLKRFTVRWQKPLPVITCLRSGIKGMLAITLLAWVGHISNMPVVMAPFAASCITVFAKPRDDFAQPTNIIFGYMIAAITGLAAIELLPNAWWIGGISLAATISLMALFRVTHPPAGAVPLVLLYYNENANITFILFPTLTGSILVVLFAVILHNIPAPKTREYPRKIQNLK